MTPLLNASRFLVLAAVLGSLLSALTLYAYGLVDTVALGVYMGVNAKGAESIAPAIKR